MAFTTIFKVMNTITVLSHMTSATCPQRNKDSSSIDIRVDSTCNANKNYKWVWFYL